MKLWEIRAASQVDSGAAGGGGGGGLVRPDPVAVFSEMEGAVHCVALNDAANLAAAGGDDGSLVVWDLKSRTAVYSTLIEDSKRYVYVQVCAAICPPSS